MNSAVWVVVQLPRRVYIVYISLLTALSGVATDVEGNIKEILEHISQEEQRDKEMEVSNDNRF